jgi:hypothetical protein
MLIGVSGVFGSAARSETLPLQSAEKIPQTIEFNRDVRPILSENCFFCHGPDKNKRQADLRLDTQQGLLEKAEGAVPVVPGKPDESELFRRIVSEVPELQMPPGESGKVLTQRDIAVLRKWIEQGAHHEGHWSFLPIRSVSVAPDGPTGGDSHRSAATIDAMIQKSLAEHQLHASPEADRITLIRRLSLDLTGLPPSIEDVERFVNDRDVAAYEKQVDRLLASPHYGERLAMWWLDLVRYADTVGYHGDQEMSVSPFRQYVIESFNANKSFDQFTIEQLAGDLLPNPSREQLVASGYNRLGMMSAEGGVQDKEYLAKYIAERVRNASGTWLGVTLGCAECHDHKFDPFSTRDFYRFEAFFADIQEQGLYSGGAWGPAVKVPTAAQEQALAEVTQRIAAAKSIYETETPEIAVSRAAWISSQPVWHVLKPQQLTSHAGATLTLNDDGSILVKDTLSAQDTYSLVLNSLPANVTAFRLEVLPHDSLPQKGPGRAENGNFILTEFQAAVISGVTQASTAAAVSTAPAGESVLIPLQNATATYEQPITGEPTTGENGPSAWKITTAIDGDPTGKAPGAGWATGGRAGQASVAVFETKENLSLAAGQSLQISLAHQHDIASHTLGRFRVSVCVSARPVKAADASPPVIEAILATAPEQRTEPQTTELTTWYRTIAPELNSVRQQLASLEKQRTELDATIPVSLITTSVAPRMVRILPRGNWMDETGEVVTPAFPEVIDQLVSGRTATETAVSLDTASPENGKRLNRLDLAKWILAPQNPLTARVTVNRLWKLYFGAGLSRRLDDLGAQGEWPSHPELLDNLANELIQSRWDLKYLIKSIVMSNTYRQTSIVSESQREADSYNRWLSHQGRFRLDAELVRDNAMSISGLLVTTLGGRSVRPYQPPGYWAYLNFPTREWQNSSGEDLYRRGLYTHWQRQYLHPGLLAFDAPSREECTAERPRSNTPLQSLVLLNDPCYVEAARAFAELLLNHPVTEAGTSSDAARLDLAFRRAVSRPIMPQERVVLEELLNRHRADYRTDAAAATELLSVGTRPVPQHLDPVELAAWTSVARTILNLHETITRN